MQSFKEWAAANKGVLIGAGIGLILAVMMLVLIAFFVGVGAALGAMPQVRAALKLWASGLIERFFKN